LPHSPVKKIELNSTLAGCKDEICCMGWKLNHVEGMNWDDFKLILPSAEKEMDMMTHMLKEIGLVALLGTLIAIGGDKGFQGSGRGRT
jgi:hypothetical protein